MPSTEDTENYRLTKRLYSRASGWATSQIVRLHRQEFEAEYDRLMTERSGPIDLSSNQAWNRAARTVAKRHPFEFGRLRTLRHAQLQVEHGYEPAPRGGFHTGRYARKVDADADLGQAT